MFKKIQKQFVLALLTSVIMFSCAEDEGNYDYIDINEVEFNGIEDSYSVLRFDDFNIVPQLVTTLGENNISGYTYKWEALSINDSDSVNKLTELSTEKDLVTIIGLTPGVYTVYYTVKDLDTDIEFQNSFELEVVTDEYEGWLVLNDIDGAPRLDMISIINNQFKPVYDLLGVVDSELTLEGEPSFVYTYPYASDFYGIYISTTGNGTTKVEPDTFYWDDIYNIYNEFISTQPVDLEVDNIVSKGSQHAYTAVDGNIYYYFGFFGYSYSAPINSIGGVVFDASPFIGKGSAWGSTILYDNTNKRFVSTNFGSTSVMPTGSLFDFTTGKDLEYMIGSNYNNGGGAEIFAILKDPADDKKYLALFNATNKSQTFYGEVIAPDFDKATSYAVSPEYGYLFYAAEGKVYEYDFSLETTKLMLDKGSDEITMIKFQEFFYSNDSYDEIAKQLIVCSYDGTEGTMEQYSVPPINGQIELVDSYSGFGKIKSVSYRER